MELSELAGREGAIAILCTGASLPVDRLPDIRVPTMTLNRAYVFPSTYYLALERDRLDVSHRAEYFLNAAVSLDPRWPSHGYRVKLQYDTKFSTDIARGFYPGVTSYLAGEIAFGLGYTELHYLGLDLSGPHFDGTYDPGIESQRPFQNEIFQIMAEAIEGSSRNVYICESPESRCTAFPHSDFEAISEAVCEWQ